MGRKLGAEYFENGECRFTVWAPFAESVTIIFKEDRKPVDMTRDSEGYWEAQDRLSPGTDYKYQLNNEALFPDPASRSQPEGVHGWSRVVDPKMHHWQDEAWKPRQLHEMVIYELHVGTFTPEATFEGILEKLDHLASLGINTLEFMPVAQFPGTRNWGYDGVYPYAVQESYGGIEGLKKVIDTCHQQGFSVLLDVVYNHLGPEGNYLSEFGPYFTTKYQTPWGKALNFDDEYSDPVREFFIQNALMWLEEFHFDGLRLDAVHEIIDRSATHFLKALSQEVDRLENRTGRKYVLIAESDLNDNRIVSDYSHGGYGLEGQWVDDFHHAVHTVLTGENAGYYKDYGKLEYLAKSFKQGFIYDGMYSAFRKRRVGNSPERISKQQLVICIQNHDQVGNRLLGERLTSLVDFEAQKLAAGILLSAPFIPMLFMGEEFGEERPFRYFVDHSDPDLVKAVREGRKKEFEYFHHSEGHFPDPQAEESFQESKLDWDFKKHSQKQFIFKFYKEMIRLRKEGAFNLFNQPDIHVRTGKDSRLLEVHATSGTQDLTAVFNFDTTAYTLDIPAKNKAEVVIASSATNWGGEQHFPKWLDATIQVPGRSLLIISTKGPGT